MQFFGIIHRLYKYNFCVRTSVNLNNTFWSVDIAIIIPWPRKFRWLSDTVMISFLSELTLPLDVVYIYYYLLYIAFSKLKHAIPEWLFMWVTCASTVAVVTSNSNTGYLEPFSAYLLSIIPEIFMMARNWRLLILYSYRQLLKI